ncbi:MAG: FAD-dependent oxidoreductase [Firmicutes bacterium]|nr:FAD-dependent oxidoreductase [Bacillota bacterium]
MKNELDKCIGCKVAFCNGCPCGTDVGHIIQLIKSGNLDEAGQLLFFNNPLSAITGAICPSHEFCTKSCILSRKGNPVNFSNIEREISKQYLEKLATGELGIAIQDNLHARHFAVVGGGPAGIAFAFYAILAGHNVVLFERESELGGMLRYGIPDMRLDKSLIDKLENVLVNRMGIRIYKNTEFVSSKDYFDEIIVATGVGSSKRLDIDGKEHAIGALEFLKEMNTSPCDLTGQNIVIVGGGNVAVDCAIVAKHHGANTTLCYRKSKQDLRAYPKEIEHAEKMGVKFEFWASPSQIKKGKAIFERDGKEISFCSDKTIIAIGQDITKPEIDGAHYIGDCVTGTRTIIEAVASAKKLLDKLHKEAIAKAKEFFKLD